MILQTNYKMKPPPSAKPIKSILKKLGCVALYLMNEKGGLSTFDLSGNETNHIFQGTPTWENGPEGKVVEFDGSAAEYSVAAIPKGISPTNPYTIMFSAILLETGLKGAINIQGAADNTEQIATIYWDEANNRISLSHRRTVAEGRYSGPIICGQYNQFAFTHAGGAAQADIHVNGVLNNLPGNGPSWSRWGINVFEIATGWNHDTLYNAYCRFNYVIIFDRVLPESLITRFYCHPFFTFGRKRNPFIASAAAPPEVACQFASLTTSLWWLKHNKGLYTEL